MLGFTKVIAHEVALAGVTCNAICPGFVDTGMVSREKLEEWAAEMGTTRRELIREVVLKRTPQYRYVAAESVATMTAYLLSPVAADITGQAINVSCGVGDY
jgi:NAD(P)-dependent dehydrogenase (short-subunit alcohol dehydrogenase family)